MVDGFCLGTSPKFGLEIVPVPPVVIRNDQWSWEEVCHYLYEDKAFDNIVISPGPGSPTCPADIGFLLLLRLFAMPTIMCCLYLESSFNPSTFFIELIFIVVFLKPCTPAEK